MLYSSRHCLHVSVWCQHRTWRVSSRCCRCNKGMAACSGHASDGMIDHCPLPIYFGHWCNLSCIPSVWWGISMAIRESGGDSLSIGSATYLTAPAYDCVVASEASLHVFRHWASWGERQGRHAEEVKDDCKLQVALTYVSPNTDIRNPVLKMFKCECDKNFWSLTFEEKVDAQLARQEGT